VVDGGLVCGVGHFVCKVSIVTGYCGRSECKVSLVTGYVR